MVEGFALRDTDTDKKVWGFVWLQAESSVGIKTFYIIGPVDVKTPSLL